MIFAAPVGRQLTIRAHRGERQYWSSRLASPESCACPSTTDNHVVTRAAAPRGGARGGDAWRGSPGTRGAPRGAVFEERPVAGRVRGVRAREAGDARLVAMVPRVAEIALGVGRTLEVEGTFVEVVAAVTGHLERERIKSRSPTDASCECRPRSSMPSSSAFSQPWSAYGPQRTTDPGCARTHRHALLNGRLGAWWAPSPCEQSRTWPPSARSTPSPTAYARADFLTNLLGESIDDDVNEEPADVDTLRARHLETVAMLDALKHGVRQAPVGARAVVAPGVRAEGRAGAARGSVTAAVRVLGDDRQHAGRRRGRARRGAAGG